MPKGRLDERGLSDVIGFVLVFALIMASVVFVSTSGLTALADIRTNEQLDNAERAFDVIAENLMDVYAGGAPSRATEVDLASGSLSLGTPITMNVTNGSATLVEQQITPIIFRGEGDAQIVYAGGAVFRTRDTGGVVVREPPMVVSSDGVHVTVVGTRARNENTVSGGTVRLRSEQSSEFLAVYDTEDTLWVNVTSPRAEQWKAALEGPAVTCVSGGATPSDVTACELTGGTATSVAVSVVRIDVSIST
ncbi:hypothetical protein Hrd1104_09300 [Halorhabdus sp. CBA1104]|uniref:DUF7289 family protein n=1 Tax=Halorhabdus sp. CBA1104 TaxID=1380432 RepID=UPI0012B1EBAA|nr:hypothetical protein [Halorhabdus sp. CBA1104]QGN07483.1 hypothetical protein Hrd1104_09300 [Halorhabdus sp. CBA1104]